MNGCGRNDENDISAGGDRRPDFKYLGDEFASGSCGTLGSWIRWWRRGGLKSPNEAQSPKGPITSAGWALEQERPFSWGAGGSERSRRKKEGS